jgi:hypothetical protein
MWEKLIFDINHAHHHAIKTESGKNSKENFMIIMERNLQWISLRPMMI